MPDWNSTAQEARYFLPIFQTKCGRIRIYVDHLPQETRLAAFPNQNMGTFSNAFAGKNGDIFLFELPSDITTGKHQTGIDKYSRPFIQNPIFMNQAEQFPAGIFCKNFISKIDGCCRRIQTGKVFRRMIPKNNIRKRSIRSKPLQRQIKSRSRITFRTEQSIHSSKQILADKFRKILFQLIKIHVFQIRHFQRDNLTGKFP